MSTYHWIKLYDEILDDPKMGRLSDGAYRLCINAFLLANRSDERDGRLPDFEDLSWLLRLSRDDLEKYWQELERAEIVTVEDGLPFVIHFKARQTKPVPVAERVAAHRARKEQESAENNDSETELPAETNGDVTRRYQNKDIDTDKEKEEEEALPNGNVSANADYQLIRKRWIELFPDKATPREGNKTLTAKVKTRIKQNHFKENWEAAMVRAAQSTFLHGSSWFDLAWFLKNDDHYDRCLSGKYDDGPKSSYNGHQPARQTAADSYAEVFGS